MAVFHFTCHCKGSACHNEGNVTWTDDVSMTTGICPVFLICVELLHGIRSLCKATQPLHRTSVSRRHERCCISNLFRCHVAIHFFFFTLFFNSFNTSLLSISLLYIKYWQGEKKSVCHLASEFRKAKRVDALWLSGRECFSKSCKKRH